MIPPLLGRELRVGVFGYPAPEGRLLSLELSGLVAGLDPVCDRGGSGVLRGMIQPEYDNGRKEKDADGHEGKRVTAYRHG